MWNESLALDACFAITLPLTNCLTTTTWDEKKRHRVRKVYLLRSRTSSHGAYAAPVRTVQPPTPPFGCLTSSSAVTRTWPWCGTVAIGDVEMQIDPRDLVLIAEETGQCQRHRWCEYGDRGAPRWNFAVWTRRRRWRHEAHKIHAERRIIILCVVE